MKRDRGQIQTSHANKYEKGKGTNTNCSCKQIWKGRGDKYKLCTLHYVEAEHFAAFYHLSFLWLENARNASAFIVIILSSFFFFKKDKRKEHNMPYQDILESIEQWQNVRMKVGEQYSQCSDRVPPCLCHKYVRKIYLTALPWWEMVSEILLRVVVK